MVTTPDRREGHDLRTFSQMGTQSGRMAWRASVLLRLFTLVVCFTLSAGDYPRNQGEWKCSNRGPDTIIPCVCLLLPLGSDFGTERDAI